MTAHGLLKTPSAPQISLCMTVKNEEEKLARCLTSAGPFVDEIVIVDTGSTDRTVLIAKEFGAEVYHHPWKGDFSLHKNQSISYARGKWILHMDADETVREGDGDKIREITRKEEFDSVMITVVNSFNQGSGQCWIKQVRLFRKKAEICYAGVIHEQVTGYRSTTYSNIQLLHDGYDLDNKKMHAKFLRNACMLKKLTEEEPENFRHYHDLAVCYSMHNMNEEAVSTGIKAIKIADMKAVDRGGVVSLWSHFIVASSLLLMEKYQKAVDYALDALQRFRSHLDSLFVLAIAYHSLQNWSRMKEASDTYLVVLKELKDFPERFGQMVHNTMGEAWRVYLVLGDYYLEKGDVVRANGFFEKALFNTPIRWRCFEIMGGLYRKRGMLQEAEAQYLEAVASDPEGVAGLIELGHLNFGSKRYRTAKENYQGVLRVNDKRIDVRLRLARISLAMNDIDECEKQCDRIMQTVGMQDDRILTNTTKLSDRYLLIAYKLEKAGSEFLKSEALKVASDICFEQGGG
jgi:glycosyltransferase involved in cell wall biosynthesis